MATIPVQGTGLRHVRKTITFTGGAGAGLLGSNIAAFTGTGWVNIERALLRCTTDMVCEAPSDTFIVLLPEAGGLVVIDVATADGVAGRAFGTSWSNSSARYPIPVATTGNLVVYVGDGGAGANITGGVIVIDLWYSPITDDGALAGDDIDTELGAYLAGKVLDEALSGHTTAGSLGKAIADVEVDTSTTLQAELDGIQADTEDIQSRLPAALVGGRIDATIDATGMEAGAIDAILTRQMTESYAADGAAPTLAQALFEIMQCLTEFAISGTTITVKKRDGSTTAMTFTLDSATAPTSRTRAT